MREKGREKGGRKEGEREDPLLSLGGLVTKGPNTEKHLQRPSEHGGPVVRWSDPTFTNLPVGGAVAARTPGALSVQGEKEGLRG
ncbi:hypothetical protein EYF80_038445 [Liparis tanakae]|uniref:Uncharacterized protein n=1 Tax=Liparis tanakae TaxID=230148 RepID=A0A4Z2GCQ8_9TELE|nr:hypothetical protein EYF80_038445 [Liparis tanakae]